MLKQKADLADCEVIAKKSINRAKSEFVTLASHQLRTPISAIKWLTELLLQGDAGQIPSEQRAYIKQIYTSNIRLSAIVDDLLLASTLESQDIPIRPEPTHLPNLCERVLADQLHMQQENKNLKVEQQYAHGLEKVALDPSLMKIILRNIFSNAVKYTPAGGTIKIDLEVISKPHAKSQHSIQLRVADSGYGIPQKEQQNIFVKLYRASNIKHVDTDGTGLGLFIVKELLKQVGGSISFSSKENVGSTFIITLPLEGMKLRHRTTGDNNA